MKRGYFKTDAKILFFRIIIAAIICGIGYFFKSQYDDEQFETIKTDMLLIEAKTKVVAEKVKIKEKDASYVGRKIEEVKEEEDIKNLQERGIINLEEKNSVYYILEKGDLEELGLVTINLENSYYIVEYNTNEIIYSKGIKDKDGNMIDEISDLERND